MLCTGACLRKKPLAHGRSARRLLLVLDTACERRRVGGAVSTAARAAVRRDRSGDPAVPKCWCAAAPRPVSIPSHRHRARHPCRGGAQAVRVTTLRQRRELRAGHARVSSGRDWKADSERRDSPERLVPQSRRRSDRSRRRSQDIAAKRVAHRHPATARRGYLRVLRFFASSPATRRRSRQPTLGLLRARDESERLSRGACASRS